ncbi:MAG: hypothetical protein QW622_02525 [Candidatus Pacearchaeota archaeon]
MIKNKKKIKEIDLIISLFLIVLTILMPITFTALQPEIDLVKGEIKPNPVIDSFASVFSKFIGFFDVVPSVMAQEPPPTGCCEKKLNGALCQDGVIEAECEPGKWHKDALCEDVCLGCCVNTNTGSCSSNAAQGACQGSGILFIPGDLQCQQLPICKKGCCTVGYEKRWETNKTCVEIYHGAWDGNTGYAECLTEIGQETRGCCTYNCKYETVEECANGLGLTPQQAVTQGHFVQRKCYNDVPKCSNCVKEHHKECIPGLPDVFWADSCGNVYVDEKISCTGNQRCVNGACADVKCTDVYDNWDSATGNFTAIPGNHGRDRYEGETWCVYDMPLRTTPYANLGSFDPVGSEHWVFGCVRGKVIRIDNSVYRQKICEEVLLDKDTGKIVMESDDIPKSRDDRYKNDNYRSFASLTGNPWRVCYVINDPEECNKQPYCYWMNELNKKDVFLTTEELDGGTGLTGDMDPGGDLAGYGEKTLAEKDTEDPDIGKIYAPIRCLPKVSPGFDDNNKYLCDLAATVQCTLLDRMTSDSYPECDDAHWVEFMAQRCRIVGDCGANINWIGESSYKGFLAAEINPEKNATDNIIGKKIERIFDVESDEKFERFQVTVEEVESDSLNLLNLLKSFSFSLSMALLSISLAKLLVGVGLLPKFLLKFSFIKIWKIDLSLKILNPATVVGVIILLLARLLPFGPLRSAIETAGYGFIGYGVAYGLGLTSFALPAAIIAMIAYLIFGFVWDVDYIVVKCGAWMPPIGGNKCEECNKDPMRPCSKYRCQSLGTACMYNDTITIGSNSFPIADAVCIAEENDNTQPYIESIVVKNEQGNPVYVSPSSNIGLPPKTITVGQQLNPFSMLTFEVTFNERVFCRWHDNPTGSFNDMVLPFGGENFNRVKRDILGASPYPSDQYIYLRCMDVHGNVNLAEYILKFDVAPLPDLTPPVITAVDPANNWQFSNIMNNVSITLYVYDANIPVNCTFSRVDGTKSYDAMKLETGQECQSKWMVNVLGCEFKDVPLTTGVTNQFYFKCKDSATNPGPNIMQESKAVTYLPAPPLFITSIVPENGAHVKGCEISGVELEVETAEGAENGKAICYWQNGTQWQRFTVTNDVVHLTNLSAVSQTVNIKCYDSALNVAQNSTSFTVEADQTPPTITRIFKDGSQLVIRTDEDATCAYHYAWGQKINNCNFVANNTMQARKFTTTGGTEHRTEWDDEPWYVKCYDSCGNGINNPCTIVYPSELE